MKIEFSDISAFVEYVEMDAEKKGISISNLDELHTYLADNDSEFIIFEVED